MDATITAALVSSLIGIIVAVVSAYVSSTFYARQTKAELEKEYESRYNERRWETYTQFGDLVSQILESVKSDKSQREKERENERLISELYKFSGRLMIVGSDGVIKAFAKWKQQGREMGASQENRDPMSYLIQLAEMLIEMRKDLGYKSNSTDPKDLLGIFINDLK